MDIFDNWLLMAIMTPLMWALCCLLDSGFVSNRIYKIPLDGPVISGLFSLVPVLMILASDSLPSNPLAASTIIKADHLTAALAGAAYFAHLYFYFKALFSVNDASGTELFMCFSVVGVPVLAFFMLGERLSAAHYLSFLVAGIGLFLLCRSTMQQDARVLSYLGVSVALVSLSMVLQAKALEGTSYAMSLLYFNGSIWLISIVLLLFNSKQRRHLYTAFGSLAGLFLLAEALEIVARFSAQRAIELGPSVSLVALVECLLPMLIILLSGLVLLIDRRLSILSTDLKSTFKLQMQSFGTKVTAMGLIFASIAIAQPS